MPELSKTVSHEYDPKLVFRNYSSNVPHLQSWIDQLIELTENTPLGSSSNIPSTDQLVQSLQRYDAVYKELLRQTNIFSEPLTKMLSEVWSGVLKLMTFMIKSYHRYVKHTSHLQTQAQNLISERQRGEAATKVQREEFELERTALRAQIRNLDSEMEALKMSKRVVEHENDRLRSIIDVYINSSELNDPVWEIMNNDEAQFRTEALLKKEATANHHHHHHARASSSDEPANEMGFRKRDILDVGKQQLKSLNRMDIEMNEILAGVLKEENRQKLLMKDLMKLFMKHQDLLSGASTMNDLECSSRDFAEDNNSHHTMSTNTDPEMQEVINRAKSVKLALGGKSKRGANMLSSSIMASTKASDDSTVEIGIQVDGKDDYILNITRDEDHYVIDTHMLGVAPLAPANVYIPGLDQPYMIRKYMTSYPTVLRVPPVAWVCQTILAIYLDKLQHDQDCQLKGLPKESMPAFLYSYFLKVMGLHSAADVQVAQLLKACESHVKKQPRVSLFASQIGLINKDLPPSMDVRDTDFILLVLSTLLQQGELQSDAQKSGKRRNASMAVYIRPDISRLAAANTVHLIFEKWLPDGGEDYIIKVKSMQQSEMGVRFIDFDLFVETLIEPWHIVRTNWEEHAKYVFKDFCNVYRIIQEATFANDEGSLASDTILVEVQKQQATDCTRRSLRLFQKFEDESSHNPSVATNSNKETVCEMINRKKFVECLRVINPTMSIKEIEAMFDEALELAHQEVLHALEQIWIRFIDQASNYNSHITGLPTRPATSKDVADALAEGIREKTPNHRNLGTNREFWVNKQTQISQWTKPYTARTFRSQDIELEWFIQILLRKDVFPRSPFIELLNIAPKDLWPNADMFYKQIKERKKRENLKSR